MRIGSLVAGVGVPARPRSLPIPHPSPHRGQALAELALVTPLLLLVLLATAQLGTIMATQVGITNAVREAAREASTIPTTTDAQAAANGAWADGRLRTDLLPQAPGFDPTRLVVGSDATRVCYRQAASVAGGTDVLVDVDASYRHALWLPGISNILDGIDGTNDGALRVTADQEILVENGGKSGLSGPVCSS